MKSVLASGCSSGIGQACAACLTRGEWRVFAGVRSDADAQSVEADPGGLTPVQLDVISQALLPLPRRAGGRILFVGSVGGRVAFPYAGPYHASKFAIEAVADSLRAELRRQGVSVSPSRSACSSRR